MCYDIISLTSLKIIQAFHLLLGFAENQGVFWDFKIQNSVRITEGSDNGDSDNRGSTVLASYTHHKKCTGKFLVGHNFLVYSCIEVFFMLTTPEFEGLHDDIICTI